MFKIPVYIRSKSLDFLFSKVSEYFKDVLKYIRIFKLEFTQNEIYVLHFSKLTILVPQLGCFTLI